eukprot:2156752-Rhodomonas_salina.1
MPGEKLHNGDFKNKKHKAAAEGARSWIQQKMTHKEEGSDGDEKVVERHPASNIIHERKKLKNNRKPLVTVKPKAAGDDKEHSSKESPGAESFGSSKQRDASSFAAIAEKMNGDPIEAERACFAQGLGDAAGPERVHQPEAARHRRQQADRHRKHPWLPRARMAVYQEQQRLRPSALAVSSPAPVHAKLGSDAELTAHRRMNGIKMLNIGFNEVEMLSGLERMTEMRALIANNNRIASLAGIQQLVNVNALVLSNNMLKELSGIAALKQLKKLSLAHNDIRLPPSLPSPIAPAPLPHIVLPPRLAPPSPSKQSPPIPLSLLSRASTPLTDSAFSLSLAGVLPDLKEHPLLEELRLNDNKIMRVPETIDRSPALKLLDLGRNRLYDVCTRPPP